MAGQSPMDAVAQVLTGNNVTFKASDIQHGRKFTFPDGAILVVYDSGKRVWQGKESPTKERVQELLADAGMTSAHAAPKPPSAEFIATNRVFIVYGHDANAREQLELMLRRLKLEPVVLQNLPSGGQTIIEKLESNTDVTYACVLLTPDDEGYRQGHPEEAKPRARQNVVLEMGMFLAKLGRKRVAILHKGNLELPSDIQGLVYIPFEDRVDDVKERVAAELQEAGFAINIKDLLG